MMKMNVNTSEFPRDSFTLLENLLLPFPLSISLSPEKQTYVGVDVDFGRRFTGQSDELSGIEGPYHHFS